MPKENFITPDYLIRDCSSKEEMIEQMERKIKAVIHWHESDWDIGEIHRRVTDTCASATIMMTRKK